MAGFPVNRLPVASIIAPIVRLRQYGLFVRLRSPILFEVREL